MGGIAQFALSQLTPDQQAAIIQQTSPAQLSPDQQQPMPLGPTPGSTADLENRAAQAPQQLALTLQNQQQPDPNVAIAAKIAQHQQIAPPTPNLSPENPYGSLVQEATQRWQALQPPADRGGRVKNLLGNFFAGMGGSMMAQAGLQTPDIKRQQQFHNLTMLTQLASNWEDMRGMQKYREALTNQTQQNTAFQQQLQPIELQRAQLGLTQEQQNIPTVRPSMSAADLASLGVPGDLAAQYEGRPLNEADMTAVKQMAAAGSKQLYDYGTDGQGEGKGIWLVDKQFNPIKQLSPISESGRATALQKQQFAQQNALLKGMQSPVYAYDPAQKATVLTTQAQAQQSGMQSIRGVKESDIRNDTHDTRVLNDVAVKANNVMDSSDALDQDEKQRMLINWALSQGENQLKVGAFGSQLPTGWFNSFMNSANMSDATQKTRDYVVNTLSLREASMGLQRVLTGSARANEAQINALQATIPGFERDAAMGRQKLSSFTQNIDLLRQGIPRMPGLDVVPVKQWSGPQRSVQDSTGQPRSMGNPMGGPSLSTTASIMQKLGAWERQQLGLE